MVRIQSELCLTGHHHPNPYVVSQNPQNSRARESFFVCKHACHCVVVHCCGKGHRCTGICVELSVSELLCVVTAGAYCHCWGMWCACCWCGLWVGLESSRLATVLEKPLWIKAQLWLQSAASVFRLEALSPDQTPLAPILCPLNARVKSWTSSLPHSSSPQNLSSKSGFCCFLLLELLYWHFTKVICIIHC